MPEQDPAVQENNSGAVDDASTQGASTIDLSAPEIQAAIQAAAEASVRDLKKKIGEFRDNNVAANRELEEWHSLGMDRESLKEIVKNLSRNKEAKLAAEGKLDELFEMRTEPMRRDFETRLKSASDLIEELKGQLQGAKQENYDLRISQQVIDAAQKNPDVHHMAIDTIVDMARKIWRIEEDGVAVPRRANGTRWISKDGKSDIGFDEWVESLKETKPFLFKSPSGVNARGGPGQATVDVLANYTGAAKLAKYRELTGKK